MRLWLGNINPGTVRVEYHQSILSADQQSIFAGIIEKTNGPYLDDSRNLVVQEFLRGDGTHLLFVDSDIMFEPDDVRRLTKSLDLLPGPLDYLTGLYYGGRPDGKDGHTPIAYRWGEAQLYADGPLQRAYVNISIDESRDTSHEIVPIDSCGAGFLLLPRILLLRMRLAYDLPCSPFAELVVDGVHFGEDHTFCARAEALGAQLYLNPSVCVPHFKVSRLH